MRLVRWTKNLILKIINDDFKFDLKNYSKLKILLMIKRC